MAGPGRGSSVDRSGTPQRAPPRSVTTILSSSPTHRHQEGRKPGPGNHPWAWRPLSRLSSSPLGVPRLPVLDDDRALVLLDGARRRLADRVLLVLVALGLVQVHVLHALDAVVLVLRVVVQLRPAARARRPQVVPRQP